MANTTQPWLEDLSEEWIPQASIDAGAQDPHSPEAAQTSQSVPPKQRSRLPRMRQSSGSFSEIQHRNVAKELRPTKLRNALAERSLSDNNMALTSSPNNPQLERSRTISHTFSASEGSIVYDATVAHNTVARSPAKEKQSHDTPEWRRRLVKGELGYGDQTDLFGNTGLQNIFQKPTESTSEEAQKPSRKLGLMQGLSAIPSSPPPWPPASQRLEEQRDQEGDTGIASHDFQQDLSLQDDSHLEEDNGSVIRAHKSSAKHFPRTVSGQIEFENESFSPVYLTTNLKVGDTPKPTPNFRGSELANRLRQIGSPPPSQYPSIREETVLSHSQEDSSLARLQDESLPEGLPAGTPDLTDVGRFVELRRGGYSRDGSFRRRPLSPSPDKGKTPNNGSISSATRPEGIDSSTPHEILNPKTPSRQANQHLSPERAKNSGSPLKLFDAHDTFTSNRLQRRLSQLDMRSDKVVTSSSEVVKTETIKTLRTTARLASVTEASILKHDDPSVHSSQHEDSGRVESFGKGQLNEYQFSGDFSFESAEFNEADDSAPDASPSSQVAPPGSRQPFRFHIDESALDATSQPRRQISNSTNASRRVSRPKFYKHQGNTSTKTEEQLEVQQEYAEGKRGPTSPFKNPTPKRRRTIHLSDVGDTQEATGDGTVHRSHATVQSVIGRKRKDARHDSNSNVADAETLARRHILRPRNPTPSQRRREELEAEILEATEAFMSSPKLNTIREHLEPSMSSDIEDEQARATAVASQVAAFSMKRQHKARDESRKRSVTTQDFLDEAVKIMNFIRTKGRPSSGLGSLEETEAESEFIEEEAVHPSSSLTFERPPSREGRESAWKEPNKHQLDPNVMSHLRKYQEKDTETFLNSSVNSIRFSRLRGPEPAEDSVIVEQDDIRITDDPGRHKRLNKDEDDHISSQNQNHGTQQSTGSSLAQTVVTNTSRRSDNVATLAPEAVAHLIPEEIAGMTFDREKNIWIRQKSPSKEHPPRELDNYGVNESEEDIFGNIPDLTVDDLEEPGLSSALPRRPKPTAETILEDTERSDVEEDQRPVTRDGKGIAFTDTSSVPSKTSNFAWSYPKTETRATSWSTQAPRNWSTQKAPHVHTTYAIPESDENDIEHEIQYFEGRGDAPPSNQRRCVRDITISFAERDARQQEQRQSSPRKHSQRHGTNTKSQHDEKSQTRTAKTLPRTLPNRNPVFNGDGDLSLLDDLPSKNYRMQLSMSVSAPALAQRDNNALLAPSSPVKGDVTFMLSDLPEFTLNQVDERELQNRVVVKHDGTQFSKALEDRYAQGTAALVKALQDVEPDEPYWEDLRKVNLHSKGLGTLYRLDELCYQLEELDVSNNEIGQVNGIPSTMRRLQAKNNFLTGLTSWSALLNLQHLDVSGNEIDSLDGLADLVHLRVLKANDNKIRSIDSILHLDGLMEISASGNDIDLVDFGRSNLKSLTDLDLSKNRLLEVRNVHRLPRLEHLNLDDNEIEEFPLWDDTAEQCKSLRSLRLCRNGMTLLDVDGHFPRLETLYVDNNCLMQILGLEHLRHLRTLSAREQLLANDSNSTAGNYINNLVQNCEVRNLYLSLNPTQGLEISQHLLNLQRLELSSMGLAELPDNFGQLTPNIRSINLNFNSIKDLRPLLNIKRLNELLLAGNKLERLRANVLVLAKLDTLAKLDWRDNPLTLRFYASTSENRVMSLRRKPSEEQHTDRLVLPIGDAETDEQHLSRLDFETRIRRRVTEMMLANLCKNLRELDGIPFDKARVLVKDEIWERMLQLGVIQRKQTETSEDEIR